MEFRSVMKYTALLVPVAALSVLAACGSDTTTGATGGSSSTTTTATGTGGTASTSTASSTSSSSATGSTSTGGDCTTQMFAKYGEPAFLKVTHDLIALAAADPKVGQYFVGLNTPAKVANFEDGLSKFLIMVYGGPNNYKGKDMVTVHTGMKIASDDYDYFIGLIVKVLTQDGVAEADINACFAPPVVDPAFKATIVDL